MLHDYFSRFLVIALAALVSAGCSSEESVAEFMNLDEAVTWSGRIALSENANVINVTPNVRLDGDGFLVADAGEAQFRIYDHAGELVNYFGSRGSGPGEFRSASVATRLVDGSILAFDLFGTAAVFSEDGEILVRTLSTPFSNVYDVVVIDDSLVYVVGTVQGREMEERIHVLDTGSGEVLHSFFRTPVSEEKAQAAFTVGLTSILTES